MQLEQSQRKLEETKSQLSRLRGKHNLTSSKNIREDGISNVKVERRSTSPAHISSDSPQNWSQLKLEQRQDSAKSSKNSQGDVKSEKRSSSSTFLQISEGSSQNKTQSRPQIVIPAVNPILSQTMKGHLGNKASNGSGLRPSESASTHTNSNVKLKGDKSCKISSEQEAVGIQAKGTKRKFGNAFTCFSFYFT